MQNPGAGERTDFDPPPASDLTARAAPVVRMLLRSLLIGMPMLALLLWPAGYRREALAAWMMSAVIALLYLLLARGRVRAAFCGLVLALIVYAALASATFGSIRGTGVYALFGAVFVAGILFGRRALVLTAIACVAAVGGLIVEINQAFEGTFEVRRAEVVGRKAGEVGLWSDAGEPDALFAAIAASGRIVGRRLRLRRNGGVLFEAVASSATLDWRGAAHYFSSITDGSAEAAARDAVKRSEERFSKAFDFSPIGLIITRESDGRYIEVNSAEERTLGHARATLLGRTSLQIGPWQSAAHRQHFIDTLRHDGRALGYDTVLRNQAGQLVDCRLFAERIEVNGEPCVLTATINVSEQKRQESLILQIARGVSAETGPGFFRSLAWHLGSATGATCVLIAEVGPHGRLDVLACRRGGIDTIPPAPLDVQSFGLGPLLGGGGVLLDAAGAAAYGGAGDPLGIAGMRGVALACLAAPDGTALGVLCAFAPERFAEPSPVAALFRIFAARAQAELMCLIAERALLANNRDLEARVGEIIGQLRHAAPRRVVRWSVGAGLSAQCDPALVRIVLTNLLGNAWKFSSDALAPAIGFDASLDGAGRSVYSVRDNGVGFDMRYGDKLFTPFQRLHRRDEFEGPGIGLVIVARIVARHGGRVEAEAAPGLGATFRFTLEAGR